MGAGLPGPAEWGHTRGQQLGKPGNWGRILRGGEGRAPRRGEFVLLWSQSPRSPGRRPPTYLRSHTFAAGGGFPLGTTLAKPQVLR